jgi:hypothetical protein
MQSKKEIGIGHFSEKNYKYNHCGISRNNVAVLYECIVCTRAWYCSRRCQKSDWSQHRLICCKTNSNNNGWRIEPSLVDLDVYHDWKGDVAEDANYTRITITELNGDLICLDADPITDKLFDCFTDRPVRIKRGKERSETGSKLEKVRSK